MTTQSPKVFEFQVRIVDNDRLPNLSVNFDNFKSEFEPEDPWPSKYYDVNFDKGSIKFHTSNGLVGIDWDEKTVSFMLTACEFGTSNNTVPKDASFQEAMSAWLDFAKEEEEFQANKRAIKPQEKPPCANCVEDAEKQRKELENQIEELQERRNEQCRKKQKCID